MGQKVDVDDLMGSEEICELLQLAHTSALHTIRRRSRERGFPFPEPVKVLAGAAIWHRPDVERWGKERGYLNADGSFRAHPRAGRPPKAD